ncbi:hypothetical protein TIFTF001_016673 [Ficus carica]|uniref:Transmembrane protein n=1 Tax=Ficus carica TaxID=3494 RepID=A0AA88A0T0_FICCA|nr:hypothetical protein TIFTF001_016673 [Ficus carica]
MAGMVEQPKLCYIWKSKAIGISFSIYWSVSCHLRRITRLRHTVTSEWAQASSWMGDNIVRYLFVTVLYYIVFIISVGVEVGVGVGFRDNRSVSGRDQGSGSSFWARVEVVFRDGRLGRVSRRGSGLVGVRFMDQGRDRVLEWGSMFVSGFGTWERCQVSGWVSG